jgi:hypothetical protein
MSDWNALAVVLQRDNTKILARVEQEYNCAQIYDTLMNVESEDDLNSLSDLDNCYLDDILRHVRIPDQLAIMADVKLQRFNVSYP